MRSPRANLESLYGGGPVGSPYLFRRGDPAKLLEDDGDVPRNQEGIALVGDPRNDTHAFMSQMQVAFIRAHNWLVDRLRADGVGEPDLFDEARRALTWHYQWVIVNDLLPRLVGDELVESCCATDRASTGRMPSRSCRSSSPTRRTATATRRSARPTGCSRTGRSARVFPDLIGFGPIGDRRVDWSLLFDVPGHPPAQRAKPIDGRLPRSLIELPEAITGAVEDQAYHSLAARDLERGQGTGLPSGEAVAREIGARAAQRRGGRAREPGLGGGDAAVAVRAARGGGPRGRGPARRGGRADRGRGADGVISADPESYLAVDPDWTPTLPARGDAFRLADLLVPATQAE